MTERDQKYYDLLEPIYEQAGDEYLSLYMCLHLIQGHLRMGSLNDLAHQLSAASGIVAKTSIEQEPTWPESL